MKLSQIFGSLLLVCICALAQEEKIDARLKDAMASIDETQFIDVIIKLKEQVYFAGENLNRTDVLTQLRQVANSSQVPIRQLLNDELATKVSLETSW